MAERGKGPLDLRVLRRMSVTRCGEGEHVVLREQLADDDRLDHAEPLGGELQLRSSGAPWSTDAGPARSAAR